MKEYFGSSANLYHQTSGKQNILIPAILRHIPQTKKFQKKLLDVACGNADFNPLVRKKGYVYVGLDISSDMIGRAKKDFPEGEYVVAPATDFTKKIKDEFYVILISMLFPAFSEKIRHH